MARSKIVLNGTPEIKEDEVADAAIIPGHLLLRTATGVVKNTANAANVEKLVAVERDEFGTSTHNTNTIDNAYAAGDAVKVAALYGGCRAYMFLASGDNVAKGAFLTGNNAGLLTATGVSATVRSFVALEAVDASGSAPVAGTRIRVEAL